MTGIANGIAHVSFPGGGTFVPARTPYDRQILIEHVVDRVRTKGHVQVLVDDQRWLVRLLRDPSTARCGSCAKGLNAVCYATAPDEMVYCVRCALTGRGNISGLADRTAVARLNGIDAAHSHDNAA